MLKKLTLNVFWQPSRPSGTNTEKRCPFHCRVLEWKSRKSRDTWSNKQIWPGSPKWSRAKANRVLPRERTGHSKHPLPPTRERTLHMDITRWSILKSDWLHSLQPFRYDQNQILYDYTVEVTNRFKWLDPIECLKKEAVIKTIPKRKKCKKAKWLSEEGLQIAEKRREAKGKREKDISIWMQSSKKWQGEIRKPSSVINVKNRGKQQNGKD